MQAARLNDPKITCHTVPLHNMSIKVMYVVPVSSVADRDWLPRFLCFFRTLNPLGMGKKSDDARDEACIPGRSTMGAVHFRILKDTRIQKSIGSNCGTSLCIEIELVQDYIPSGRVIV